jgi:polysaccharide biosynthesis transport protein
VNRDLALTNADGSWPIQRYDPAHAQQAPTGFAPTLDFSTFVRVLREWRWLIVGAAALGLALGIIYTLLSTPLYRSTVTLEVNPPSVQIMDREKTEGQDPIPLWELVQTQAGLLKSRSVAERAVQDLNLANNAAFVDQGAEPAERQRLATNKVMSGLSVEPPTESQLIRYSFVSDSPQIAAAVVNAIAESFINSGLQRRFEASAFARRYLQQQIAKTRADLERSERALVAYAQQQGIINTAGSGPEGQSGGDTNSLQGQSLVQLNQALADATARRVAAEGAYRQSLSVGQTSEVAASTSALRQSRATLEAEYQEKRTLMKPDHPEMLSLRSRIGELDRQIAREAANVSSGRNNSLLADYRGALAAERALQGRVAALRGSVLDLRGRSVQYNILQRELDTNRTLYDGLLQRYKEIGVAGNIDNSPVSIVDRGQVPSGPFKPSLLFNVVAGLLIGLIGGVLTAMGLEFLNDTIKTRSDVRTKLGLACLGAIPKRSRKDPLIEELQEPSSPISEAYTTVATSLRFSTDQGMPKVLLVTSARATEGKSSTALALAQSLSRRGGSVLLIDSDLRKPAFKSLSDKQGLTRLLTTDEPLAAHISPTQFENLWLLPSGPIPPNPADLLSTHRFASLLREAAERFDMLIVDAPPVLGLADAPLLAASCKDVMMVVEAGKTRTPAAQEAISRIRAAGGHVLGATLTKSTEESSRYGYGYGYGHGYGKLDQRRQEIALIPHQAEG